MVPNPLQRKHSSLNDDVAFQLLSNARRRHVIQILEEKGQSTKGELAEEIASIENDKPINQLTSQERKNTLVSLHQVHLSKMEGYDAIQRDGDVISPGENIEKLAWYIEKEPTHGIVGMGYSFLEALRPLIHPRM